jgi:hypothetical protein
VFEGVVLHRLGQQHIGRHAADVERYGHTQRTDRKSPHN